MERLSMLKGGWDSCLGIRAQSPCPYSPPRVLRAWWLVSASFRGCSGCSERHYQRDTESFSLWVLAADGSQLGPSVSLGLCWSEPPRPRWCLFSEGGPCPMTGWCGGAEASSPCLSLGQLSSGAPRGTSWGLHHCYIAVYLLSLPSPVSLISL